MPELPEIIVIRNGLKRALPGKKVLSIESFADYPLKPSKSHYVKYIVNTTVIDVFNIAKLLVLKQSSGWYLAAHLKMDGSLTFNTKDKYKKICLHFKDGSYLCYSTIRKLGFLEVWDQKKLEDYSKKVGRTILESGLTPKDFVDLIRKRRTYIKTALLDQKHISGIGNIYANDALYLSCIHPKDHIKSLSDEKLAKLFTNLIIVLNEGIKNGGSSISRYRDAFGQSGTHQDHFLVYGKKGHVCTQCHKGTIEFEKIQGRGSYFCPQCQKTS